MTKTIQIPSDNESQEQDKMTLYLDYTTTVDRLRTVSFSICYHPTGTANSHQLKLALGNEFNDENYQKSQLYTITSTR